MSELETDIIQNVMLNIIERVRIREDGVVSISKRFAN